MFALPEPGSPKSQLHEVGLPVDVSVNPTVSGPAPEVGVAVKLAVGGVATVM